MTTLNLPRPEMREEAGYAGTILEYMRLVAKGQIPASPASIAATEVAVGIISRGFASAFVEASPLVQQALSPFILSDMARRVTKEGDMVYWIDTENGLRLLPVATWSIKGGANEDSWNYKLTLQSPSGPNRRRKSTFDTTSAGVVHLRYSADPMEPWRGIGPMQMAAQSGRLAANLATALADEAGSPRGSFLPTPAALRKEGTQQIADDATAAKGAMLFVRSTTANWDQPGQGPRRDFTPQRFGADMPESMVRLEELMFRESLAVYGVPPGLHSNNSATSSRESYRQLVANTISPLGRMVEHELRRKLEDNSITFGWAELRAADVAGKARAYGIFRQAGMGDRDARVLSGIQSKEEVEADGVSNETQTQADRPGGRDAGRDS